MSFTNCLVCKLRIQKQENSTTPFLKLHDPILYQILCTLLNDGYAKYVYNNRHCGSFPGQLSHISIKIIIVFLTKKKVIKRVSRCLASYLNSPLKSRWG